MGDPCSPMRAPVNVVNTTKTSPTQTKVIPAFPVSWEVSPRAMIKSRVRDLNTVKSKWTVIKNAVLLCFQWIMYSGFLHAYTFSLGST